MHIAIISNLFPPHMRGGAERVAFRVAKGLRDRGHQVTVISTKPEGSEVEQSVEDGMKIYRFRPHNIYYTLEDRKQPFWKRAIWHLLDLFNRQNAKQVRNLLTEIKPDAVVTHNLKGIGLAIPRLVQKKYRHIHILHDVQLVIPSGLLIHGRENGWQNRGLLQKLYTQATRRALGEPTLVISPSRFLLNFHKEHGLFQEVKTKVLPNPTPEFGINERKKQAGPLRVLYLGSLEPHKGIAFLLDALKPEEIYHELTIAGKGSLEDLVKQAVQQDNRMNFFGPFNLEEAAGLLGVADCAVVPSLCYENSPTVIYEALGCGVPVIASKIGGIPELVREGENGFLFEPGDAAGLIKCLEKMYYERDQWFLRQDEIRMSMSQYSMTYYLDKFEALLNEL